MCLTGNPCRSYIDTCSVLLVRLLEKYDLKNEYYLGWNQKGRWIELKYFGFHICINVFTLCIMYTARQ